MVLYSGLLDLCCLVYLIIRFLFVTKEKSNDKNLLNYGDYKIIYSIRIFTKSWKHVFLKFQDKHSLGVNKNLQTSLTSFGICLF